MKRYSKGIKTNDHTLTDVFSAYECNRETQFVEAFFGKEEMNTVIEACGLSNIEDIDRKLETPITIGMATKRADLTFEDEGQMYYFEVMSQSQKGKWDNDHHEQFYLKSNRLKQDYEQVYSFAIAFKEFDAPYLNEFSKMEDSYAIHLRFNDQGYFADVYGIEEKKEKVTVKLASLEELGLKWMKVASSEMGFKNRKDLPHRSRYLYIGKAYTGSRLGIEWVINQKNNDLGIKISGYLVRDHGLNRIIDETGKIIDSIKSKVPGFEFVKESSGANDKTISFKFDNTDFSEENVKLLKDITVAFAEELGIENLLK
jgi:hypothetical protein|tara:strand:- start:946 stop:1887 length:942 start_codon:yes stop_codon:yes gene_type:complete